MAECAQCKDKIGFFAPTYGSRSDLCGRCATEAERLREGKILQSEIKTKEEEVIEQERIERIQASGTPQEKLNLAIELRDFSDYSKYELDRILSQIKVTTAHSFSTHDVVREIDVISSESVQGMHLFKDLFAGVRDVVGGRSKAVQDTLRQAKTEVMRELKIEAMCEGGNAVIAVDLDYHQMSAGTSSGMMMLVASGTAVVVQSKIS